MSACPDRRVWHAEEERLLRKWEEMCKAYGWMHEQAERRTSGLRYLTLVPILVLNAVAASVAFVSMQTDCESNYGKGLESTAAIFNVVAGGLVVLDSTLKLWEIKEKHHECASLFARIGRLIQSELSIPRKRRLMDGYDFLRMVSFDVDRIITMNVPIPESVKKRFEKMYESSKKPDPFDVFLSSDEDSPVEIVVEAHPVVVTPS